MSSNRSVPQQVNNLGDSQAVAEPDYAGLVRLLVQPFLESSDSLSVDCEISPNTARVWIRVAFEGEDKGRVFGRGGRNIQAIRTVIAAAAAAAGHSVYLDIYGSQAYTNTVLDDIEAGPVEPTQPKEPRGISPKPVIKPRSPSSSD